MNTRTACPRCGGSVTQESPGYWICWSGDWEGTRPASTTPTTTQKEQ